MEMFPPRSRRPSSVAGNGVVANPVFEPEARSARPASWASAEAGETRREGVGGFRGETVLVTFAKTKVTRGYGGGAPRGFYYITAEGDSNLTEHGRAPAQDADGPCRPAVD